MPIHKALFDPEITKAGVIDPEVNKGGVIDFELIFTVSAAFDPATMAAMNRPWPIFTQDVPAVVPAGMAPPDFLPP